MRLLNDDEKKICKKLLSLKGRSFVFSDVVVEDLEEIVVILTRNPLGVEVELGVEKHPPDLAETQAINNRIQKTFMFLLTIVKLIEGLEKEGLILLMDPYSHNLNVSRLGVIKRKNSALSTFNDMALIALLASYIDKKIILTKEFERFCKNGFITRDEQRFQRQISLNLIALGLAIVALSLNTFFNLRAKPKAVVEIKESQIDIITSKLDSINNEMKKLNTSKKLDTSVINQKGKDHLNKLKRP